MTSNWDNSVNNISNNNDFEFSYLDATNNRSMDVRSGFSYFRGLDSSGSPFSFPRSERRRIAIIDNTDPSTPIIRYNAIPQRDSLSASDVTELSAAINSITPAPLGLDFTTWQAGITFPLGLEGATADPDGDGDSNLFEFFAGTDPLDLHSRSSAEIRRENGTVTFQYQVAKDRIGVSHQLQTGALDSLQNFTPDSVEATPIDENLDLITVTLPPGPKSFIRRILTIEP